MSSLTKGNKTGTHKRVVVRHKWDNWCKVLIIVLWTHKYSASINVHGLCMSMQHHWGTIMPALRSNEASLPLDAGGSHHLAVLLPFQCNRVSVHKLFKLWPYLLSISFEGLPTIQPCQTPCGVPKVLFCVMYYGLCVSFLSDSHSYLYLFYPYDHLCVRIQPKFSLYQGTFSACLVNMNRFQSILTYTWSVF